MTAPDDPSERVDLGKHAGADAQAEAPFDPYRFGAPDVPPPPEYAPPGYQPPPGYQYPSANQYPTNNQYPHRQQAPEANPHGPYPPYPYGANAAGDGQPGYGPPPGSRPPQYGPYGPGTQPVQGNGRAVAALVLGIASIVLCWTTIFDAIIVILAVVFGVLGLAESRRRDGRGHGQAIAGLVCAALGAVLAIVFIVVLVHLANQCGGLGSQNDSAFQQCLRDKI